ncbi:MAG: hypothetical protein F2873_09595, partial [Actinobacteria bacterium]|nr:hypothetical protein [Actinomycetota bacterium]
MTRMNYGPRYRGSGIRGWGGGSAPPWAPPVVPQQSVLKALLAHVEKYGDISRESLEHAGFSLNRIRGELYGADLSGLSAISTDFSYSTLDGANLSEIDGSGAVFDRCSLVRADLAGACLEGASFRGADLSRASLRGCNLSGVDFTDAELERADLTGAYVFESALVVARYRGGMRRPDGSIEPWKQAIRPADPER